MKIVVNKPLREKLLFVLLGASLHARAHAELCAISYDQRDQIQGAQALPITVTDHSIVYNRNQHGFAMEIIVHKAPMNVAVLSLQKTMLYQRAFLSAGSKHIQSLAQGKPDQLVFSGPAGQGTIELLR